MRMNLRNGWLAWGPVLALMVAIFVASAQPKHAPPGSAPLYMSGAIPVFTDRVWDALVKKSAHVVAYAILAALVLRALRAHGMSIREAAYVAMLLALGYALTDELHQASVAGRHASALDIGFDFTGAAVASRLARWRIERREGKRANARAAS